MVDNRSIKIQLLEISDKNKKESYLIDFTINFNKKTLTNIFIICLFVFGAFLRMYNLEWDQGLNYHPDENNIAIAVSKFDFPDRLDPEFYAYNGFVLFIVEIISQIFYQFTNDEEWLRNWSNLTIIGRYISALAATASIPLFYKILRELFSKNWTIFGTALFIFTTGLIQTSHYAVSESLLVFQLLLIIFLTLKLRKNFFDTKTWIFLTIISGITIGTKTTGLIFLFIPLFTVFLEFIRTRNLKFVLLVVMYLVGTACIFAMVSPISIIYNDKFFSSMEFEKGVVDGTWDVKYTHQFRNTNPIFFIENLLWYTGTMIPVLFVLGIPVWIYTQYKNIQNRYSIVILLFGIIYMLYVGSWYAKFIRYTVPFIPIMIISAVYALHFISKQIKHKFIYIIPALVLTISIIWSLAFFGNYLKENSRIEASKWISTNIPSESVVLTEHWDMKLPSFLPGMYTPPMDSRTMRVFDDQTVQLANEMSDFLAQGDYYIIGSQRGYGPLMRIPEEYPYSAAMYESLFSGELGYTEIHRIERFPKFGPIEIDNSGAEETFKVFDHPTIIIFENTGNLSSDEIYQKIINHQF